MWSSDDHQCALIHADLKTEYQILIFHKILKKKIGFFSLNQGLKKTLKCQSLMKIPFLFGKVSIYKLKHGFFSTTFINFMF